MPAPSLIAHIGTHKTASTAIQRMLHRHAHELRQEGTVYVPIAPKQYAPLMRQRQLASGLVERMGRDLRERMSARARGATPRRYLLSWEGWSGDPATGYDNAEVVARSLRQMVGELPIQIIVYLRRQDTFMESMYTQLIHQGESGTFEEYQRSLPEDAFDWEALIERYARHFGKESITPRIYSREALPKRSSIIEDFGDAIESPALVRVAEALPEGRSNSGYSREALEIARMANPYLSPEERRELRGILQQTSAKRPFESYTFWGDQRAEVLARYQDSNARVAREHFDGRERLFPEPEPDEGSSFEELSMEDVTVILVKAMLSQRRQGSHRHSRVLDAVVSGEQRIKKLLDRAPGLKHALKRAIKRA